MMRRPKLAASAATAATINRAVTLPPAVLATASICMCSAAAAAATATATAAAAAAAHETGRLQRLGGGRRLRLFCRRPRQRLGKKGLHRRAVARVERRQRLHQLRSWNTCRGCSCIVQPSTCNSNMVLLQSLAGMAHQVSVAFLKQAPISKSLRHLDSLKDRDPTFAEENLL